MIDQANITAKRYVDVTESRKLIDGIWESIPTVFCSINITNCYDIRYFNPSVDLLRRLLKSEDMVNKSLKMLFFNKYPLIKPIASFSNDECTVLYNELIHRIKEICLSQSWDFDKGSLNEWLIVLTVEDLSSNITPELLKKVITSMNYLEEPTSISLDLYHKVAATIITAYTITDSTYLSEAFDYSIISHFYNHNNRKSIFTFRNMLNRKDFTKYHPYLNYYIFHTLVIKLYQYKLNEIEENNELVYQRDKPILMNIPEYIIVSRNTYFDIFEVE